MLRLWSEIVAFYRSLTPTVYALKQTYGSPVFGFAYTARIDQQGYTTRAKRGNCMTFAVAQKRRYGGHVINIKSRFGWWFHSYWLSDEGVVYEFAPVQPHRIVKKFWHPLPPLVYQGKQRVAPVVPPEALRKISAIQGVRAVDRHAKSAPTQAAARRHAPTPVIDAAAA